MLHVSHAPNLAAAYLTAAQHAPTVYRAVAIYGPAGNALVYPAPRVTCRTCACDSVMLLGALRPEYVVMVRRDHPDRHIVLIDALDLIDPEASCRVALDMNERASFDYREGEQAATARTLQRVALDADPTLDPYHLLGCESARAFDINMKGPA